MKERFGAQKPESMWLRFHCQTAGSSLTQREPMNNIARTALQGLSAILGGAQSLHTNGMDEAIAIPSEEAMKVALRTQQILREETGAANTVDPLAGSFFVESLTSQVEERIWHYIKEIDSLGGAAAAASQGYFDREIAESAYHYQRMKEAKELTVVGVNKYVSSGESRLPFEPHRVDPGVQAAQLDRLRRVKATRDNDLVQRRLADLVAVARTDENVIPETIEAVRADATMGEIVNALKSVFGTYRETPIF